MRIAVASRDGKTVSGHIGRCADWIVYEITTAVEPAQVAEVERVTLPKELVFHHFQDDKPHPLQSCNVVIGGSCGESFVDKMKNKRGIEVVLTAETDPVRAVVDYVSDTLLPAKPRPIGGLLCKIVDALSPGH